MTVLEFCRENKVPRYRFYEVLWDLEIKGEISVPRKKGRLKLSPDIYQKILDRIESRRGGN